MTSMLAIFLFQEYGTSFKEKQLFYIHKHCLRQIECVGHMIYTAALSPYLNVRSKSMFPFHAMNGKYFAFKEIDSVVSIVEKSLDETAKMSREEGEKSAPINRRNPVYAIITLSSAEASYFFVRAGNWGEVKSKRAKPGENPPRSPYFSFFVFFAFPH